MMTRFTLYGSPHSLPTYKVALMLRLSGELFSFRYGQLSEGHAKDAGVSGKLSLGSGSGSHRP
jgi:hypothetical protein